MIKAIIIEDEPKAALELKEMLSHVRAELTVMKIVGSVEESIAWLQGNEAPDLIFSDIQLSDGVSFEIFHRVKVAVPVIFCTAFDEYMLKAFEANGIAYLLKPVVPDKLSESLRKYDDLRLAFAKDEHVYTKRLDALMSRFRPSYHATLLISVRDKIVPLKTEDIGFFYYERGVVSLFLFNGSQYFIEDTMDALEAKLNPSMFFRINRQFIIHRNAVQEIERYFSRKLVVKTSLKTPETIVVSKLKAAQFLTWLTLADSQ